MLGFKPKKKNKRKEYRELALNISMFLLRSEKLKNLFWNVKNVEYSKRDHKIKIGINTTKKLGTTLKKLRSLSKELSNYLYDEGLTVKRVTRIEFYVDREDEMVARIYNLLDTVELEERKEKKVKNS
jgi:ribosome-binding factor A